METSKTDKAVVTVAVTTLLTFLIVNYIGSIWLLYPNLLIAIGLFGYCIWQNGEGTSLLSRSLLFGFTATLTYIPMDWLFSRKVHLIFYLPSRFSGEHDNTDWVDTELGGGVRNTHRLLLSAVGNDLP